MYNLEWFILQRVPMHKGGVNLCCDFPATLCKSTFLTPSREEREYSHHFVGGKWSGIYDFFKSYPELLDKFEYFWFPDDDIETTSEDVERFLKIVFRERFQLAQPALKSDSYYAYRITLANPRFRFRRTNFVELMMPIIHRDLLLQVLPVFANRHFAQGMDFIWHQLARDPLRDVAIIDEVPMGHYRPRQTNLKGNMSKAGVDMMAERERTFKELSIRRPILRVQSGLLKEGLVLNKGPRLTLELLKGLLEISKSCSNPPMNSLHILHSIAYQYVGRSNVSTFDYSSLSQIQRNFSLFS
ncbi:DUF707 domain-containing protein [Flexibacterium corallicola]|uniref:DUF707 domain-containing protein n=1 Tax=Flexibacterium corallicola TaxID=3037259 RepID=UPI00286FA215|nr:DUF707 domain-containing protein [Pseudovibrio sp. M1P-2-3]